MAQWSGESSRKIIYRAIASGQFVLKTPAHFGTGEQDGTELIILQDCLTGSPLIPGASQAGALRHYLLQREKGYRIIDDSETKQSKQAKTAATQLFGEALNNNRGEQSRLITHDAYGTTSALGIRDSVKINRRYRTADDGALFNVQVWPKDTAFDLRFELYICEGDEAIRLKQAFAVVLQALSEGEIRLGARKHRGFGYGRVATWEVYEYDFSLMDDFLSWVSQKPTSNSAIRLLNRAKGFPDQRERVTLSATFILCDSLMIRTSSTLVNNKHLTDRDGQAVLSGTSITGALRSRALKIAKTLKNETEAEDLINDMFGWHGDETNARQQLTASRIHIEESTLSADLSHIQNRNKLDGFAGGTYETALMSEQPAFATPQTRVQITLELQYPALADKGSLVHKQTGLLLLLLKDLWLEDLPLGGESSIGRGRLKGSSAELKIGMVQSPRIYHFTVNGLQNSSHANELQRYVDILWE